MGTEIHVAKVKGRRLYALLSTVTMSYRTEFLPLAEARRQALRNRWLTREGWKRAMRQKTTVRVSNVTAKTMTVSYPVYRLTPKKPQRAKRLGAGARMFDGKKFLWHERFPRKWQAQQTAEAIRKRGYRVRITKVKQGYDLWTRPRPQR